MYGWINGCLEDLIIEVYGVAIWEKIKKEANCQLPTGDFFRSVHYDDDSTYKLVASTCNILGAPVDILLEAFGRHFIHYLEQNGYDSTMKSQGNTLREWIKNVNEPHRILRSRFPKSSLPEFWTENDESDVSGETVLLHYYSTRGGRFIAVVVGIIKEAAKRYFDQDISMDLIVAEESTHSQVNFHGVWRIPNVGKDPSYTIPFNRSIASFDEKRTEDNYLEENRCPFDHGNPQPLSQNPSFRVFLQQSTVNMTDSSPTIMQSRCSNSKVDVGLSGTDFRRIFPYHIVVNRSMRIIQTGNTLATMMEQRNLNVLNCLIGDYFTMTLPDHFPLNWESLRKLRDANIEMVVTSFVVKPGKSEVKFRGEVMFLNEHSTNSDDNDALAVFLINPYVLSMDDLIDLDLSINNLPKHSYQRDVLLIGEHLRSETDYGIKLTRLSKRLDQESKKANVKILLLSTYCAIILFIKDALKMKRIFVRYVSHEIRTPLNVAILGLKCLDNEFKEHPSLQCGDTLKDDKHNLPDPITEIIDDVKISCVLAVEILNDLLLYEKIDDGIFSITTSKIPIRHLIEDAEKLFRMQARAANIDFVLDLQNKVLDTAIVDVDKSKLQQVLRNLVTNAIKFTPPFGEVRLTCQILTEEQTHPSTASVGYTDSALSMASPNIPQPHFLPLLQRSSERGRLSRSDSFSSIGSCDVHSCNSRSTMIHFASHTMDRGANSMMPSCLSTVSVASNAKSVAASSICPSVDGPHWPTALSSEHKSWEISEIIDPSSAKYSSVSKKKRPHWEMDIQAAAAASTSAVQNDSNVPSLGEELQAANGIDANISDRAQKDELPIIRKFVRIAVQDTGPGISVEDQLQLFHEFIQVKADKLQNGQGSGLGLWIAANIMTMHGGRIGVLSEGEGKGSTFLIDIPLAADASSVGGGMGHNNVEMDSKRRRLLEPLNDYAEAKSHHLHSAVSSITTPLAVPVTRRLFRDTKVLIVDDVMSNRKVVRRILRDKFAFIDEAENGKIAVNKILHAIEQKDPFHLVLMDFMMPVMNGLEATRLIKEHSDASSYPVVVIGVTGNGLEMDIEAFKDAGADEVMLKPLDYNVFLQLLQKHGLEVSATTK